MFIAAHVVPEPEYPELQVHVFVFDPVSVHVAFTSQPPLLVRQLFSQHVPLCSSDCALQEQVTFPPVFVDVFTVPPRYPEQIE